MLSWQAVWGTSRVYVCVCVTYIHVIKFCIRLIRMCQDFDHVDFAQSKKKIALSALRSKKKSNQPSTSAHHPSSTTKRPR